MGGALLISFPPDFSLQTTFSLPVASKRDLRCQGRESWKLEVNNLGLKYLIAISGYSQRHLILFRFKAWPNEVLWITANSEENSLKTSLS